MQKLFLTFFTDSGTFIIVFIIMDIKNFPYCYSIIYSYDGFVNDVH